MLLLLLLLLLLLIKKRKEERTPEMNTSRECISEDSYFQMYQWVGDPGLNQGP